MKNCKYCGRALEDDVVICQYCSRTQPDMKPVSGDDGGREKPAARPHKADSTEKKKKIILIALAVIIALCVFNVVIRLIIRGRNGGSDPAEQTSQTAEYVSENAVPSAEAVSDKTPAVTTPDAAVTTAAQNASAGAAALDMSKEEALSLVTGAVNKTRDYTGDLTVNHSESFEFEIQEITGGEPVKALANTFINAVMSPSEDTIEFHGGKAEYEDETVPILLPDSGDFSLPAEGVQQFSAEKDGDNTVIKVTLVEEKTDKDTPPRYNAGAFGYVDLSNLDLPGVTPERTEFTYGGTQIEYVIRPDGYVQKASYNAQLSIDGNGTLLVIPASLVSNGTMTEVWDLQWD